MDDFLYINPNGKNIWWSDVPKQIERMTAAWSQLARDVQPAIDALLEWGERLMRVLPPEERLSAIEQEYAFRAYAEDYNARHPKRRISWRRLNWRQRAEAALNYSSAPEPPDD